MVVHTHQNKTFTQRYADWRSNTVILFSFFVAKIFIHLLLNGRFEYHPDELEFIELGKHLAFGSINHTPLVPWIARLSGTLWGYSLPSIRFFPAVAGAISVLLTILLVQEWGGKRSAQMMAGLAMLVAPVYLLTSNLLFLLPFELLFWTLAAYLVVCLIKYDNPKLWLLIGFVAGLGLLTKYTMFFWGTGLIVGLILTGRGRELQNPWLWAGGSVAFLIFLPNLIWQYQHDWVALNYYPNYQSQELTKLPRGFFLLGQVAYMNPLSAIIWIAGLLFFFSKMGRPYRLFGWMYLTILAILLILHSRPIYLASAYSVLFAGGAVWLERTFEQRNLRWPIAALQIGLLITGWLAAEIVLPIRSPEQMDKMIKWTLSFVGKDDIWISTEFHKRYGWPVYGENTKILFAEFQKQYSWPEQVAVIGQVYQSLSIREQEKSVVLTKYSMQADAVNFFGEKWNLPPAVSGDMTYYIWGPPDESKDVIITYGMGPEKLTFCGKLTEVAQIIHPLAKVNDNHYPVYLCRFPVKSLQQIWPKFKRYSFDSQR